MSRGAGVCPTHAGQASVAADRTRAAGVVVLARVGEEPLGVVGEYAVDEAAVVLVAHPARRARARAMVGGAVVGAVVGEVGRAHEYRVAAGAGDERAGVLADVERHGRGCDADHQELRSREEVLEERQMQLDAVIGPGGCDAAPPRGRRCAEARRRARARS